LYDGDREFATRAGFSIVVVDDDGTLLGFGNGRPPWWIRTSGGAEAWAFFVVVDVNPTPPGITTDCIGILDTLDRGRIDATMSRRPLARLWEMIFGALDDYPVALHREGVFLWMPAHGSASTIGHALRSDGRPISPIDWRANRLADALAKSAARAHRVSPRVMRMVSDAIAAMEY
jgi:hypothetical protein